MVLGKPQTDPTLEWFLSHCHIHKYPSKSTLIHQGEKAETLYYICLLYTSDAADD